MTGDTSDMLARLKMVLPARWFADATPILDALLSGFAAAWSGVYLVLTYVRAQTRIATATDIFLDLASTDYFGTALPRRTGESDADFSARIQRNLLAPRATRASLVQMLTGMTGRAPTILEPLNATDLGGYDTGILGYGVCGAYGCRTLPFQFFVTAYRPAATAVNNAGGYNSGPGGYNYAPMLYADVTSYAGATSDADIHAAIASVLPTCGVAWTIISN